MEQELEKWEEQILRFEKLRFKEAQELYKKSVSTTNEELKKIYMDKLVLGTLYIPYNYIKRNNLLLLCSSTSDINDIINTMNELWIKKIYDGELLNVESFSLLFSSKFFNDTCINLLGNDISISNQFCITEECISELFSYYVELKNENKDFNFEQLLEKYYRNHYIGWQKISYSDRILLLFEKMYQGINFDKLDNLEISPTKINNFIKVLINIGMFDTISKNFPIEDIESTIVNEEVYKTLLRDVDSVLTDRERKVIHQRLGLDNDDPKTLYEVGNDIKKSPERVRRIEMKAVFKLRRSRKIKEYKK